MVNFGIYHMPQHFLDDIKLQINIPNNLELQH